VLRWYLGFLARGTEHCNSVIGPPKQNESFVQRVPEDTDEVMLGRDKALKEAFQERKLKATLTHIIDIPYDGGVFGPTTRDPSGHELQRIYTHLWWMAEIPVKDQKSKAKKGQQT
jgi:hypothetical protein